MFGYNFGFGQWPPRGYLGAGIGYPYYGYPAWGCPYWGYPGWGPFGVPYVPMI